MGFSESGKAELVPSLRFPEFRNSPSWKRKSLSELFTIGSGKDYKHLEKGDIPVYGTGGYMLSVDGYLYDGESVCIGRKGRIDKPMFLSGKFWTVDTLFYTHSFKNCLPKFIYYCFENIKWHSYNEAAGVPSLSKSRIEKIKISIPQLDIQGEIVRILDKFADLTARIISELKAELAARQKQYSYYREKLFTFEEDQVEWKTLAEVGKLVRGNGLQKKDFTETGVPAIHYGQIYTYYGTFATETKSYVSPELAKALRKVDTGDVIITNTSENIEDVGKAMCYLGQTQAVTGGHATIFKPSEYVLGKYLAYFTQVSVFASQKRKYAKGTKVIDVSATDMAKIKIPVPSLANQKRIVSILDKFDVMTKSISECLMSEIKLRQQQYEYYRKLLLNFPNP